MNNTTEEKINKLTEKYRRELLFAYKSVEELINQDHIINRLKELGVKDVNKLIRNIFDDFMSKRLASDDSYGELISMLEDIEVNIFEDLENTNYLTI